MRCTIISIVSAVYLIAGTIAAPVALPADATGLVTEQRTAIASLLPGHSAKGSGAPGASSRVDTPAGSVNIPDVDGELTHYEEIINEETGALKGGDPTAVESPAKEPADSKTPSKDTEENKPSEGESKPNANEGDQANEEESPAEEEGQTKEESQPQEGEAQSEGPADEGTKGETEGEGQPQEESQTEAEAQPEGPEDEGSKGETGEPQPED